MANGNVTLVLKAYIIPALMIVFFPILLIAIALHAIYINCFKKCRNISGEVAVVTGAAHGLGKAISMELAQRGCHIAVADINIELAEKTAQELSVKHHVKAKAYKVDVSNYEEVVELNEMVTKDLGAATILINNAGIILLSDPLNPDCKEVQRMININLTALFWTNRVFLPHMKNVKKGNIVAIASIASFFPLIFNSEYTSTKTAVRAMMRVLRQELKYQKYKDIIATTICPTFLYTNEAVVNMAQSSSVDILLPMVTGEKAAALTVQGMLKDKEEILIPSYFNILYRMYEMLPAALQDWVILMPLQTIADKVNKTYNLN